MKKTSMFVVCAAVATMSVAGCKKKDAEPAKAPAPAAKAQPAPAAAPAEAPLARSNIGVPECDEWLRKVEACMAKDPAMKSRYERGFRVVNAAWAKTAAEGGANKAALPASCRVSLSTLDAVCK